MRNEIAGGMDKLVCPCVATQVHGSRFTGSEG